LQALVTEYDAAEPVRLLFYGEACGCGSCCSHAQRATCNNPMC